MARRRASITINAKDKASPVFRRVSGAMKALGAVAAAVGTVKLARDLARGAAEATNKASIQQDAEIKLAQAIRNTGGAVDVLLPKYKAMASLIQDQTGIGDELILNNQAILVSLGKLEGQGLERATRASLDLAKATGMDAKAAFDLVAKAASGYTSTLSRYGILVDKNLNKTEKFEQALTKIEDMFGGQAQRQLRSYSGRIEELEGRWGDLLEQFGRGITESGALREGLAAVSNAVKEMTEELAESGRGVELVDDGVIAVAKGVKLAIAGARNLVFAWNSVRSAFNLTLSAVSAGLAWIPRIVARVYEVAFKLSRVYVKGITDTMVGFVFAASAIIDPLGKTTEIAVGAAARAQKSLLDTLDAVAEAAQVHFDKQAQSAENFAKKHADANMDIARGQLQLELRMRGYEAAIYGVIRKLEEAKALAPEETTVDDLIRRNQPQPLEDGQEPPVFQAPNIQIFEPLEEGKSAIQSFAETYLEASESIVDGSQSIGQAVKNMVAQAVRAKGSASLVDAAYEIANAIAAIARHDFSAAGHHFAAAAKFTATAALAMTAARAVQRFQGGGIVEGPPGVDQVPARLTRGESVLTVDQTRAILDGRAQLVPIGARRGGDIHLHLQAWDGEDALRVLQRHPAELAEGVLNAAEMGYL